MIADENSESGCSDDVILVAACEADSDRKAVALIMMEGRVRGVSGNDMRRRVRCVPSSSKRPLFDKRASSSMNIFRRRPGATGKHFILVLLHSRQLLHLLVSGLTSPSSSSSSKSSMARRRPLLLWIRSHRHSAQTPTVYVLARLELLPALDTM